jgi:hypothetical protein
LALPPNPNHKYFMVYRNSNSKAPPQYTKAGLNKGHSEIVYCYSDFLKTKPNFDSNSPENAPPPRRITKISTITPL